MHVYIKATIKIKLFYFMNIEEKKQYYCEKEPVFRKHGFIVSYLLSNYILLAPHCTALIRQILYQIT